MMLRCRCATRLTGHVGLHFSIDSLQPCKALFEQPWNNGRQFELERWHGRRAPPVAGSIVLLSESKVLLQEIKLEQGQNHDCVPSPDYG